jgi:hypothetical protein
MDTETPDDNAKGASPDEAAALADQGPAPETADFEQAEESGGFDVVGRLMETDGGETIGKIQTDHGVDKGMAYLIRAVQKFARADGTPAVADVVIGIALAASERNGGDGGGTEDVETDAPPT